MNNKKMMTVILVVLAVVCIFAVLVFSGVLSGSRIGLGEEDTSKDSFASGAAYTNGVIASADSEQPYLETNLADIYYTMSTAGNVQFYRFENNAFTPIEATGTYSATVTLSATDISADITYYREEDGSIAGFGLYTGESGTYTLYPYALFRLTSYGRDYAGKSSKSCLLLIDTTQDDFYSNEKVYEESFLYTYADGSVSRSLSEASRTVGINGTRRSDYFVINDTVIHNAVSHQLFFSGRQYAEEDERVDLMRSGGSGNNVDNILLAKDVLGNWVKSVDGMLLYLTVDEENNVVLETCDTDGGNVETIKTFDGVSREDILVSGDFMYIISRNTLCSLEDGSEISLLWDSIASFKADLFQTDGKTVVLRGYINQQTPVLLVASADGTVQKSYADEFFRSVVNPMVREDGRVILTVEKNGKFTYYIF